MFGSSNLCHRRTGFSKYVKGQARSRQIGIDHCASLPPLRNHRHRMLIRIFWPGQSSFLSVQGRKTSGSRIGLVSSIEISVAGPGPIRMVHVHQTTGVAFKLLLHELPRDQFIPTSCHVSSSFLPALLPSKRHVSSPPLPESQRICVETQQPLVSGS
jgi:hypothetical protein